MFPKFVLESIRNAGTSKKRLSHSIRSSRPRISSAQSQNYFSVPSGSSQDSPSCLGPFLHLPVTQPFSGLQSSRKTQTFVEVQSLRDKAILQISIGGEVKEEVRAVLDHKVLRRSEAFNISPG